MKQRIRLNEAQLNRIVTESVKRVLSENIKKETNDGTKTFRLKRSTKPGKGMLFYKGDFTYEVTEVVDREFEDGGGFYTATWWTVKAKVYGPNPYKSSHN